MKLKFLLTALTLVLTILGLMHWFVYSMATISFIEVPVGIQILFGVGWLLAPSSLLLSMSPLKPRVLWGIVLGYVWLGTITIGMVFAFVQFVLLMVGVVFPSWWVMVATAVIALWSLRINFMKPIVVRHRLRGPEFLKGLKVVQISDLHVGQSILGRKWLQGVVDQIVNLNPDMVVVTGDLADGKFEQTRPMLEPLSQLKMQKYYITGNHEYITGGDWETVMRTLGFSVLHNTHALVHRAGGTLLVAGVPDRGVDRFRPGLKSDPDEALATSAPADYRILLAHEPSSVFDIQKEKCDLLLSGHTHGGQIFPFGIFVRLQQPVSAGFRKIRDVLVFAHTGTGFWGPPMRWFTRCEIVEFTWELA